MEKPEPTQTPPAAPPLAPSEAELQRRIDAQVSTQVALAVKTLKETRSNRLSKLREIAFANQDALALELAESDKPLEECMTALVKDAKERGGKQLARLHADPAKGVESGNGDSSVPLGGSVAPSASERELILNGSVDTAKAKAAFEASAELKAEFGQESNFLGYLGAMAAGTHKFKVLEGRQSA